MILSTDGQTDGRTETKQKHNDPVPEGNTHVHPTPNFQVCYSNNNVLGQIIILHITKMTMQ